MVIWSVIKLLTRFQRSQKLHRRIIQKHLQMRLTRNYLKKNVYLQKKSRKLSMNWYYWNSVWMVYQKVIIFLDYTQNQSSNFQTETWNLLKFIELKLTMTSICNSNSQIEIKTSILESNLCDHSHAYTFVKVNILFINIPP